MGVGGVLAAAGPLLGSIEAAAALGASLRLRSEGGPVEPLMAACLDAVLEALGVCEAVRALGADETSSLLALVEGSLAQAGELVADPGRAGWDPQDPGILVAQGNTSALLAGIFQRLVVPSLGGDLAARLEVAEASFLDVGAGVAALSIAMCRLWPSLRVVGVDPWEPALLLARQHVAAAGLTARIELRRTAVEQLEDTDEHALAWVPTFFISETVLEAAIDRVHAALCPGGCTILGLYARPADPVAAAVADLRTVRQGGTLISPAQATALMTRAGFDDVDVLIDAGRTLPVVFVVGRRRSA